MFEAMSHTILAGITVNNSIPHLRDTYSNWGKKQLTQEEFDLFKDDFFRPQDDRECLLEEIADTRVVVVSGKAYVGAAATRAKNSKKLHDSLREATQCEANQKVPGCSIPMKMRVHDWLLDNGYSNHLKGLDIQFPANTYWDEITFENCSLSKFQDVAFEDVTFLKCHFGDKNCDMIPWVRDSLFVSCLFEGILVQNRTGGFIDNTFVGCFNVAPLSRVRRSDCEFYTDHGEEIDQQWLQLQTSNTTGFHFLSFESLGEPGTNAIDQTLRDLELARRVYRPLSPAPIAKITIPAYEGYHGPFATSIEKTIRQLRGEVLGAPRTVENERVLEREVSAILSRYTPESGQSRAQFVFEQAKPGTTLAKILAIAKWHVQQSNGLLIPGGPNVCEVFYKPVSEAKLDNIGQTTVEKDFEAGVNNIH